VKALVFERSLPRYAAARVASAMAPGGGARVGPLRLSEIDQPVLPGPDWRRISPILAGICGSDLATVDGHSSRYFEPIVSFPFVPGHEIVGELADGGGDDGARVVVEPVLACAARAVHPLCPACAEGQTGNCERVALGHLKPGLQTGYCADTGGGWSSSLVAHTSQIHMVPDAMSDEEAVMVEPTACGIHAALAAIAHGDLRTATVAVIGAGTLGLTVVAALRHFAPPALLLAGAKHPEQTRLASSLGADQVLDPDSLIRAVRRHTRSLANGSVLTGGADVVIDCVGSADSLQSALSMVRPRGRVVLAGMPGTVKLDLTSLWNRETSLIGAYAYGAERIPGRPSTERTFALAFELVAAARLGQLVGARYPLDRFAEAIAHASAAGRRGTAKVVFDLRPASRRPTWRSE
jgi:threonine dehydrogenase-like Zn-dependent dehydrogenase